MHFGIGPGQVPSPRGDDQLLSFTAAARTALLPFGFQLGTSVNRRRSKTISRLERSREIALPAWVASTVFRFSRVTHPFTSFPR
jgi:hypothetical protein